MNEDTLTNTDSHEAVECTHDWSYLDEPFAETMICAHCGETQR